MRESIKRSLKYLFDINFTVAANNDKDWFAIQHIWPKHLTQWCNVGTSSSVLRISSIKVLIYYTEHQRHSKCLITDCLLVRPEPVNQVIFCKIHENPLVVYYRPCVRDGCITINDIFNIHSQRDCSSTKTDGILFIMATLWSLWNWSQWF